MLVDNICRLMVTRVCPPAGPCVELCARFESDDPTLRGWKRKRNK